ncbi:unnamed protein product [Camellia sinensis]
MVRKVVAPARSSVVKVVLRSASLKCFPTLLSAPTRETEPVCFKKWEVQERRPSSSGELKEQQIIHSHIPEPSSRGNSVPIKDQRRREVNNGGTNHLPRHVQKEDEQRP